METDDTIYDEAAHQAVELANTMADAHPEADLWDLSDGLLAGAVHYWLFSRQPCGSPMCMECEPISTPEQRLAELLRLVEDLAVDSEYYQSENDVTLGRA